VRLATLFRAALSALILGVALAPCVRAEDPELSRGVQQVDEGDFERAIVTLEPVARRLAPSGGPDAVQAFLYLGIAQLALDQRKEALLSFRRALDLDPDLTLSPDFFSPKVRGALEEARRERNEAARAAGLPPSGTGKGGSARTVLLAGAGIAAAVSIVALAGGDSSSAPSGELRFSGARFAPPAIECPDGVVDLPITVGIEVDATNPGEPTTLSAVSSTLIIVSSPAVPGEVGFASSASTTASPSVVPGGATTLRLQTTLQCSNGTGDDPRYNEWSGRVTLATGTGAVTLETVDRLRVNIP
jgi:hypothetical protein